MKDHLVIIGILALLLSVGLSGCSTQQTDENQQNNARSPEETRFVGTWKDNTTHMTLELSSDGTCSMWGNTGTWAVAEGKIHIDLLSAGVPFTYTYFYVFFFDDDAVKLIPTKSTTGSGYFLYRQ